MKVSIAGASGYTGLELLRILSQNENIEVVEITSRQYEGKRLSDIFPHFKHSRFESLVFSGDLDLEKADYYFLCLPHEPSVELVYKLYNSGKKIIDLSAAYRIKNEKSYEEFYNFKHKHPELLEKAIYGLPEIYRSEIKNAKIIANPGCYPTASLIGIYPAVKENIISDDKIIINALSGISGAGRKLKENFHYPEAFGNAYAYSPVLHRHIPEMEDIINQFSNKELKVRFTPHILPVARGMIATIHFETDISLKDLQELYYQTYKDEFFIRFETSPPKIKNVVGTNFCDIYINKDDRTGLAIVITAIDNLGKGASSQAVQNFNLMAGFDEKYTLDRLNLNIYP